MALNNCLHCGGEAAFVSNDTQSVYVACKSCKIRTPPVTASVEYAAKDSVAAVWNAQAPDDSWPDWTQPLNAESAYSLNARVSHNGTRWISSINDNVWEPGVYGWSAA